MLKGYHVSHSRQKLNKQSFTVNTFEITSNWIIKDNQRLPNDLGQGLYVFVDELGKGFYGFENAKAYARVYRSNLSNRIAVIVFSLEEAKMLVLDLSMLRSIKIFNEYKKLYQARIQNIVKTKLRRDGALSRYNLDGIFLEHLLRYHPNFKKVNTIISDSFTPMTKDKPRSSIPNERELYLINMELIDWTCIKEVYNGL